MDDRMRAAVVVSFFLLLSVYERATGTLTRTPPVPLHFSLVVSFGLDGFNSSGTIPAIDLALEQINTNQTVLPEYELRHTAPRDSECNRGSSLDAFFGDVQSEPVKIALLGCGCSVATEPVAEISHRWNISQISFASAVSSLSDRTRFRKYFRTFPTFENSAPALLSVLEHYGWKRIAFLTQNENLFNKLYSDFQDLLDMVAANTTKVCCFNSTNITVVSRSFQTHNDPVPYIRDVFEENSGFRIFFVNSYSAIARRVICEAAKRDLIYPRYTWILYGWYPERWWTSEVTNNSVPCTDQELESFLEESRPLVIQEYPIPNDVNSTAVGEITRLQFDELYKEKAREQGHTTTVVGSLAFDGVWALALALNRTMQMVEERDIGETGCEEKGLEGDLVPLDMFNYTNGLMGCVIRWCLEQTDFDGASGRIQFDVNGTIIQNRIRLLQYRRPLSGGDRMMSTVRYGFVDRTSNFELQYEAMENDSSVFPAGVPPDGTPEKIIHTFHPGLVATYYILATLGVCFAIGCLLFNTAFHKRKVIQMTSPNLNYFIGVGALLLYASVYVGVLHTIDETAVQVQCILYSWLYVVGYLLAFGTVLAKMWRIYHIFHNPTPNKTPLRDWHLMMILLVVTGIGVLLMVIRTTTQFATETPFLVPDKEDSEGKTELGNREEYCVWQCYGSVSGPFYSDLLIFAYFALLQIVVILLALQTRKVKVTGLNDSKFVAVLVFISSVILVKFILVIFSLRGYINITAALINGGILVWATTFLVLMFIPKMVNLYRDPRGEKIFQRSNPSNNIIPTNASKTAEAVLSNGGDGQLVAVLEGRIQEQKLLIEQKDKQIRELEKANEFAGN